MPKKRRGFESAEVNEICKEEIRRGYAHNKIYKYMDLLEYFDWIFRCIRLEQDLEKAAIRELGEYDFMWAEYDITLFWETLGVELDIDTSLKTLEIPLI